MANMEKPFSEHESIISPTASSTGDFVTEDELTLWQAVSKWRKVVLYCVGLNAAVLLYGYDQAIVGSVSGLPAFQRDFGELMAGKIILPSLWLGLWNVGTPIGVMIGAVIGGWFQDRVGRRWSLSTGSVIAAMGIAVMFTCFVSDEVLTRRALFLAGKLVQGLGIGMIMSTTQTWMSEVLPPLLRGPVLSFLSIFTLLGQLIGAIVVFKSLDLPGRKSYTVCFASQWPFSIATLIMAFFLPESPTYLIRKDKIDLAYKAQTRLNEPNAHTESIVEGLRMSIQEERKTSQSTYMDCFKGQDLRRTMIVVFSCVIPQTFGLTLLAKASYFLQVVGMKARTSVMMVVVGIVVGLAANTASFWTLSHFGRRTLILISLSLSAVLWTAAGIAGCFSGTITVWYTATTLMVVILVNGLGAWPASSVVASEVSTLHLRAKSQGIGWFTNGLAAGVMGFVLPYIFNPDEGDLKAKTGFVYGGMGAIAVMVTWFIVPEMKGRNWVEIDRLFEERVSARNFERSGRGVTVDRGVDGEERGEKGL
ncbi:hypothetical protein V493_00308 [Pseudogymnoascus sp. VKM F-4281 (FW-2241)]|nr:hypothetical protein V493_00308 [Pseudogymnoascus sp. VKM F-4281 (FW-2241)]